MGRARHDGDCVFFKPSCAMPLSRSLGLATDGPRTAPAAPHAARTAHGIPAPTVLQNMGFARRAATWYLYNHALPSILIPSSISVITRFVVPLLDVTGRFDRQFHSGLYRLRRPFCIFGGILPVPTVTMTCDQRITPSYTHALR